MYRVLFTGFSENDLIENFQYYDLIDENLAQKFVQEIQNKISKIKQNPNSYFKVSNKYHVRRCVVQKFPYSIYFRVKEQESIISITAILHQFRNPKIWRNRMKG